MTDGPPPYPRTPHLWPVPGRPSRLVLSAAEARRWLCEPVVVEEKLDGANVSLWADGSVQVASRGGAGAMDRGGQLGRLRAWAAERSADLRELLAGGHVLYGEWLWLRHGIGYDRLPDWLVALDLWHPDRGFADLMERDERCARAGLVVPPRLFTGVLHDRETLLALLGQSRVGPGPAEGLVLRASGGRRCKLVAPAFARRGDEDWVGEREHNALDRGETVRAISKGAAR